ncbi:hypothetical protein NDU88_012641 [Pleurodeles waltl]|uniref:C3H1-type domain-containing protein n=1 Tax=Pleurodeles waltl TaxID=8319 RepID=A0AAV7R2I3_PLEWA|nr:hypothetical protein NDU88_012641 [Pleurodeles waltl]
MEEVNVEDQQDDLERMLAQMRTEALKRGKDWLRKKMDDAAPEGGVLLTVDQHAFMGGDNGDLQSDREQTRKPNKQQKSMGKPAKKPTKTTRAPDRDTASPPDPETPESSSSHKSTDGEHISTIIKECLKPITPLLLKSGSAGSGPDYTGKVKSQENHSKGEGSGAHAQGSDRASPGDPMPASGMPSREIEPGNAWLEYDKSFRLKLQAHPEMEWNEEDVSSYIQKMMVAKEVRSWAGRLEQPFRNSHFKKKYEKHKSFHRHKPWTSSKGSGDKGVPSICWKYETDECTWGHSCKFRHGCSSCGGGITQPQHAGETDRDPTRKRRRRNIDNSRPVQVRVTSWKKYALARSPIKLPIMRKLANEYHNKKDADLLVNGFEDDFPIPVEGTIIGGNGSNLKSAREHPEVVQQKINKELRLGRVEGPLPLPLPQDLIISPQGVVPKRVAGQYRLIHHLSFPEGTSVNDNIPPEACSVGYATVDDAIDMIKATGRGALLAKDEVESAFRLLPVHPDSFYLLGFQHNNDVYIDKAMPVGCSIACAYYGQFSTFLEWALHKRHPVGGKMHYLDDFLFVGKPDTDECANLLMAFQKLAEEIGVPLAMDKTVGPSTSLVFLGIKLDIIAGTSKIPGNKRCKLQVLLLDNEGPDSEGQCERSCRRSTGAPHSPQLSGCIDSCRGFNASSGCLGDPADPCRPLGAKRCWRYSSQNLKIRANGKNAVGANLPQARHRPNCSRGPPLRLIPAVHRMQAVFAPDAVIARFASQT